MFLHLDHSWVCCPRSCSEGYQLLASERLELPLALLRSFSFFFPLLTPHLFFPHSFGVPFASLLEITLLLAGSSVIRPSLSSFAINFSLVASCHLLSVLQQTRA